MIYRHRIYGKIKITDPVILDLIKSKAIQRLKYVEQGGYAPLYNNIKKLSIDSIRHNRLEHSIGVFILLKKFDASLKEQIAGLVHDISHGVFSHAVDYLFDRGSTQDYGDKIFNKFFKQSNIPQILKKYGYQLSYFLNKKNFPILEKDLPDICADRLDYILMLAIIFKEATRKTINSFLSNLLIINHQWVFKNYSVAKKFAQLFYRINTVYLSSLKSAVMHQTIANLLKYSLDKKYITKKDIFSIDEKAINKIKKYLNKDSVLKNFFIRFRGKVIYKNDSEDYNYLVFCKSRVVDPKCFYKGKIKKISEIDKKWKKIIRKELKPKKYFLKLY